MLDVDALRCPRCLSAMVVLAFITDTSVLTRILRHLGLPTTDTSVLTRILRHLGLPTTAPPLAPAQCCEDRQTNWLDQQPQPSSLASSAAHQPRSRACRAPP